MTAIFLLAAISVAQCMASSVDSLMRETFALKTNVLYDAGGVPSLAVEFPVSHSGRWSMDISGTYNPIRMSGSKFWKNWLIQPEIRYNFGHELGKPKGITYFWGTHILGGQYNLQRTPVLRNLWKELNDWRFQGWGIGAGTGMGVRFNISANFGIELEASAGYIYTRYNRYNCGTCGERAGRGTKHYVGLSKAAVNFLFRLMAPVKKQATVIDEWPVKADTVRIERADTIIMRDTIAADTVVVVPEIRHDRMALRLDFRLDSSDIDLTSRHNAECLDSLRRFIDRYREDMTLRVRAIHCDGYSSIEGKSAYNQKLSERRAMAVANYITALYPEFTGLVDENGHGEDWETLVFSGKERLMSIPDEDERQKKLIEIDNGRLYEELMDNDIPATRRVEVTIDYTIIK